MGCKPSSPCGKNMQEAKDRHMESHWLSQEDVKEICFQCYINMRKKNITRIKKDYFFELLKDQNMTLYEVTYTGEADSFNLFGKPLLKFKPIYYTKDELPLSLTKLRKMGLEVTMIKQNEKPSDKDAEIKGAKMKGLKGLMWIGPAPKRINDHGTFIKNEPVFDLSDEAFEYLSKKRSFKVV